ncbi:MAG: uracil-DNA glycosylase [Ardenticatenales bacterium]|nr:uracil-DNA glycosylase [Ardenticatenales bacterium]
MNIQEAIEQLRQETIDTLTPTLTEEQTQVVFAAGDPTSPLMLVGEAPGPQEDQQGTPFVGPSGKLLESALTQLGLTRDQLWISNTVKVWPNTRNGRSLKTRPPQAAEKKASRPFFEREIELIRPKAILCLGGTAAQAVIDKSFKITQERGQWREGPHDTPTMATFHPSYILRLQGMAPADGAAALQSFIDDLRLAAQRAGLLKEQDDG